MAERLNPQRVDDALFIYEQLFYNIPISTIKRRPEWKRIAESIEGEPTLAKVDQVMRAAATRTGRLPELTIKLKKISNDRIEDARQALRIGTFPIRSVDHLGRIHRDIIAGPTVQNYPDPFTGKDTRGIVDEEAMQAAIAQEEDRVRKLNFQYEPVPKDADVFQTIKSIVQLFHEASAIVSIMEINKIPYRLAVQRKDLNELIDDKYKIINEESKRLANDPVYRRYIKDFPVVADSIGLAVSGPYWGAIVPLRESLVMAMIALDDPVVRQEFRDFATSQGVDHFHKGMEAAGKRIEKAVFSKEFQQRRVPIDIVLGFVMTSPMFLRMVGLPETLPQNLVMKGIKGIASEIDTLGKHSPNQFIRGFANSFRDINEVKGEKMIDAARVSMRAILGKGAVADEAIDTVIKNTEKLIETIGPDVSKRWVQAQEIVVNMYDAVASRFVGLSPKMKVAVMYRVQGISGQAPKVIQPLIKSPRVIGVADTIVNSTELLIKTEGLKYVRSGYWPAFRPLAERQYKALMGGLLNRNISLDDVKQLGQKASTEFFKVARTKADVVIATVDDVDDRIFDLAFRFMVNPMNEVQSFTIRSARNYKNILTNEMSKVMDNMDALKATQKIFADVNFPTPNQIFGMTIPQNFPGRTLTGALSASKAAGKLIKRASNALMLKARFGAWMFNDALDGVDASLKYIATRIKQGKRVSFKELFNRRKINAPEIFDDMLSHSIGTDNIRAQQHDSYIYMLASKGERIKREEFSRIALGSNESEIAFKAGKTVKELTKPQKQLALNMAIKDTQDFILAYNDRSAFTMLGENTGFFPFLTFWKKAILRDVRNLGRIPEAYKLSAFTQHKIEEMNEEYPDEWKRSTVKLFGRSLPFMTRLSSWPIINAYKRSYYGQAKDTGKQAELQKRADALDKIQDPRIRAQILDNSEMGSAGLDGPTRGEELQNYLIQRPSRIMATFTNFVSDLAESRFVPIGPPVMAVLKPLMGHHFKFSVPHWIPSVRQITEGFSAVPLEKFEDIPGAKQFRNLLMTYGFTDPEGRFFDPEGKIFPAVREWNSKKFTSDHQVEELILRNNGRYEEILEEAGGSKPDANLKIKEEALENVRTRRVSDYILGFIGPFGRKLNEPLQELWNGYAEDVNRRDLIVPTDKNVEQIRERYGNSDLDTIDLIFRESFERTSLAAEQAEELKSKIFEKYPGLGGFEAISRARRPEYKHTFKQKEEHVNVINSLPENAQRAFIENDGLLRSFLETYTMKQSIDADGNGVFEFSFNDEDLGMAMAKFAFMSDDDLIKQYREGKLDIEEFRLGWPWMFNRLQMVEPLVGTTDPLPGDKPPEIMPLMPQFMEKKYEDDLMIDAFKALGNLLIPGQPPFNSLIEFYRKHPKESKNILDKTNAATSTFSKLMFGEDGSGGIMNANMSLKIPELQAAEPIFNNARRILMNPASDSQRILRQEYEDSIIGINDFPNIKSDEDERQAAIRYAKKVGLNQGSKRGLWEADDRYNFFFHYLGFYTQSKQTTPDLSPSNISAVMSLNEETNAWASQVRNALWNNISTQDEWKLLKQQGLDIKAQGRTAVRIMIDGKQGSIIDELDHRANGFVYRLGRWQVPRFDKDKTTETNYFNLAFSKPNEIPSAWQARLREEVSDPKKFATAELNQFVSFFKKRDFSVADALQGIRQGLPVKIPLDATAKRKMRIMQDQLFAVIDDPLTLAEFIRQEPDTMDLLRIYEPRTYKTVENRLFGDNQARALRYAKATGFTRESMDYIRRFNPATFNRLYSKDLTFRNAAIQVGLVPVPIQGGNVSIDTIIDRATGKVIRIPVTNVTEFLRNPEPLMPDPLPPGTFSNLPNMLNTATIVSRTKAAFLMAANPNLLNNGEKQFLKSPPSSQIFQTFPGMIGQGFREGILGPQEVIGQLKGVSDFAFTVGALNQTGYNNFNNFLINASNVAGATNFGFQMGRFLDDSFNLPSIPRNRVAQFAFAGGPVPTIVESTLSLSPTFSPAATGFKNTPIPEFAGIGPQPAVGAPISDPSKAAAGAGVLAFIPGLNVIFAVIAAGFAIASVVQSSRRRKKAKRASQRQQEEQRRAIEAAKQQARLTANIREGNALAVARLRTLQRERALGDRDFEQRVQTVLKEGVTPVSLAAQPEAFRNRFIDRFEPEVIEFTRRPQFDSRVGLIESIQNRIPRARF